MEKTRDAVISLVFLKFAGDKFEKRREQIKQEYGDIEAFIEKSSISMKSLVGLIWSKMPARMT